MCGITAVVKWGDIQTLQSMTGLQSHRGPDDFGIWHGESPVRGWVGLGSQRLSILDLSHAGHMPMPNAGAWLWITYNGEIYNYPELRKELEAKGYRFRSGSDTEAILYLYEEEGIDCVKRLNGMFAFAIWDAKQEHLFVARDHFGIKPLYYASQNGGIAFASEAKSLLRLPGFEAKINHEALHRYITFLWVPDPLTIFDGIFKLPAGHHALFKNGELRISKYWDLTFPPTDHSFQQSDADLTNELRERFLEVVRSQLLSDVPLGAFLSAGLDSSSIVAAMSKAIQGRTKTYTITFPERYRRGELMDDPAVAARTAQHFGCDHREIVVDADVASLLPKLIWHMDEPIADPAIIAAFLVSREAAKGVKVLLSGVGGDELFAGYRKHVGHSLWRAYHHIPSVVRKSILEPSILSLPIMRGTRLRNPIRLAKKMARAGSLSAEDRFLMDSTYFSEADKSNLYSPALRELTATFDPWSQHRKYFESVKHADFLNQMLYVDAKAFMTSLNLTYNDKMSMAASVEVRVPFLDWKFAEWVAWNVPPRLKLRHGQTKYILRQAMAPLLPAEVLSQRKAGFGAPSDHWLATDLREMVDDLLSESRIRDRGLFDAGVVKRIVSSHRSGSGEWAAQIWQLLTLEVWMQTFMDSSRQAEKESGPTITTYASADTKSAVRPA